MMDRNIAFQKIFIFLRYLLAYSINMCHGKKIFI